MPRHFVQQREVAELLSGLEQDEKRQPRLIALTLRKRQLGFLNGRAEAGVELLVTELLGEPRVGGAHDRCHAC
ncbi:hypothetical protein CKO27_16125 [Thiocystis violacea]|nr:hypothetical protein [Thiocystis violacea]